MDLSAETTETLEQMRIDLHAELDAERGKRMPMIRAITEELDYRATKAGLERAIGKAPSEKLIAAVRAESQQERDAVTAARAKAKADAVPRKAAIAAAWSKAWDAGARDKEAWENGLIAAAWEKAEKDGARDKEAFKREHLHEFV